VLLGQPAPNLRAYPPETVIAEKFQAMVALGLANTRLKDFYDIWILAQTYDGNRPFRIRPGDRFLFRRRSLNNRTP
jgi:Nucleotidyl transferase AbiEii toxin, Type IV TA system